MKDPHVIFCEYLEKKGGRYTSSKRQIADEVFHLNEHFEIENFIDHLRAKYDRVARATVYRTIKQLLDASLLQKISTRDGKVFYEQSLPQNEHAHFICNECGKIYEIHEKGIQDIIQSYCQKNEFSVDYQSIHIYGKCQNGHCSKNNS